MRPLTHAVPGALMQLLRETPLSDGKVGFAWNAVVGPAPSIDNLILANGFSGGPKRFSSQYSVVAGRSLAQVRRDIPSDAGVACTSSSKSLFRSGLVLK